MEYGARRTGLDSRHNKTFLHSVQTVSGVHPVIYTMCTSAFFLCEMCRERGVQHSIPTSTEVKNTHPLPPYVFMCVSLN
jgi:hypothetical protein